MAFIRSKRRGNKDYYYLVENSRNGKKVKQTCLLYLGTRKPSLSELDRILKEITRGKGGRSK